MTKDQIYSKLEWHLLLEKLANHCQTQEGKELALNRKANLKIDDINYNWSKVTPLLELIEIGYRAPIGELIPIDPYLKGVTLGQILEGLEIRDIFTLLIAVKKVYTFAQDLSPRCTTLLEVKKNLDPVNQLYKNIEKAIDHEGNLLDTASEELNQIRRHKRGLRKTIEQRLKQILHTPSWELYLQDEFYTIRQERYVLPIKLDGRGRVKGQIIDTSESGQTLYIEPEAIAPLNQTLQDLDLSEKLEMIRIFKDLSQKIAAEGESLKNNYEVLVALDLWTAEAQLGFDLGAKPIHLSESPKIELFQARHPLITTSKGEKAIPSDISFGEKSKVLIVSGPNAGGKTVILKTLGLCLLMAKSGLLVPAEEKSELGLFENLHIELGDAQSLVANLSTFSGHIQGVKPILESASEKDLVLLDEIAVGTEPHTGAAIAQAIIEHLAEKGSMVLVTTHYDNLKQLAMGDELYRNASMEYAVKDYKPTYKLILDVPGQSYGIELAQQIGLPDNLIDRARSLKGNQHSSMDEAIAQLMKAREEAQNAKKESELAKQSAEQEKLRWENEVRLLEETRKQAKDKIKQKYENQIKDLKSKFDDTFKEIKQQQKLMKNKNLVGDDQDDLSKNKSQAKQHLDDYQKIMADLSTGYSDRKQLPGYDIDFAKLQKGDRVYMVPLGKEGIVERIGESENDPIHVSSGLMTVKMELKNLRKLRPTSTSGSKSGTKVGSTSQLKNKNKKSSRKSSGIDEKLIQLESNTVDVRGMVVEDALAKVWKFIDTAVLKGEPGIYIIHGHGTDSLKIAIRDQLSLQNHYGVSFSPGNPIDGGDGVTMVVFND